MKNLLILLTLLSLFPCFRNKDRIRNLDIRTRIDRVHVFGFDFSESRSAKGGIWNLRTGKPETPLNYMDIQKDTIDSQPVVRLYRQVALGDHPLNGWETWTKKKGRWVRLDDAPTINHE